MAPRSASPVQLNKSESLDGMMMKAGTLSSIASGHENHFRSTNGNSLTRGGSLAPSRFMTQPKDFPSAYSTLSRSAVPTKTSSTDCPRAARFTTAKTRLSQSSPSSPLSTSTLLVGYSSEEEGAEEGYKPQISLFPKQPTSWTHQRSRKTDINHHHYPSSERLANSRVNTSRSPVNRLIKEPQGIGKPSNISPLPADKPKMARPVWAPLDSPPSPKDSTSSSSPIQRKRNQPPSPAPTKSYVSKRTKARGPFLDESSGDESPQPSPTSLPRKVNLNRLKNMIANKSHKTTDSQLQRSSIREERAIGSLQGSRCTLDKVQDRAQSEAVESIPPKATGPQALEKRISSTYGPPASSIEGRNMKTASVQSQTKASATQATKSQSKGPLPPNQGQGTKTLNGEDKKMPTTASSTGIVPGITSKTQAQESSATQGHGAKASITGREKTTVPGIWPSPALGKAFSPEDSRKKVVKERVFVLSPPPSRLAKAQSGNMTEAHAMIGGKRKAEEPVTQAHEAKKTTKEPEVRSEKASQTGIVEVEKSLEAQDSSESTEATEPRKPIDVVSPIESIRSVEPIVSAKLVDKTTRDKAKDTSDIALKQDSAILSLDLRPEVVSESSRHSTAMLATSEETSPLFQYTIWQKFYFNELEEASATPVQIMSRAYTNIDEANKQAKALIEAIRNFTRFYGANIENWYEMRDKHDCISFSGSFTTTNEEKEMEKKYHKIWVEQQLVWRPGARVPNGKTPFINKTIYILRLCKLHFPDEDMSSPSPSPSTSPALTPAHRPKPTPIRERLSLTSPSILFLLPSPLTETYTVLDLANRAARRLQVALSHKRNPISEAEKKWQEEDNRKLRDQVHALDPTLGGVEGCWKSEFNGLGGERYGLVVEECGVGGPRNI